LIKNVDDIFLSN